MAERTSTMSSPEWRRHRLVSAFNGCEATPFGCAGNGGEKNPNSAPKNSRTLGLDVAVEVAVKFHFAVTYGFPCLGLMGSKCGILRLRGTHVLSTYWTCRCVSVSRQINLMNPSCAYYMPHVPNGNQRWLVYHLPFWTNFFLPHGF